MESLIDLCQDLGRELFLLIEGESDNAKYLEENYKVNVGFARDSGKQVICYLNVWDDEKGNQEIPCWRETYHYDYGRAVDKMTNILRREIEQIKEEREGEMIRVIDGVKYRLTPVEG